MQLFEKIYIFNLSPEPGIECIDVGCGEGYLGKLLKKKFGDSLYLVGCDISRVALNHANPYFDENFQIDLDSDEIAEKISGRKFDYIFCLETLEVRIQGHKAKR